MVYIRHYSSPLGDILLSADEDEVTGLWFDGGRYYADGLPDEHTVSDTPPLLTAVRWLDVYFSGREPDFTPPLHPVGSEFRREVWKLLTEIPYGKTVTYGDIAKRLAKERGLSKMSAQAVGGAVGHNPISLIIPCHRVVGANGSLTGYAGGTDRKAALLTLEHADMTYLFRPDSGSAL